MCTNTIITDAVDTPSWDSTECNVDCHPVPEVTQTLSLPAVLSHYTPAGPFTTSDDEYKITHGSGAHSGTFTDPPV